MNIRPLHDFVIIRRNVEEQRSAGGIVIPDTATEKPAQGEVLAVGNGMILKNGNPVPPDVKTGDQVLFGQYAGSEIKLNNEELVIMHESDILAVLEE